MYRMWGDGVFFFLYFCENGVFGIGVFSLKFVKNKVGIFFFKFVCVENLDWVVLL